MKYVDIEIVDGSTIDLTSEGFLNSIEDAAILEGDKILLTMKDGKYIAFQPVNDNQVHFFSAIADTLHEFGFSKLKI